MAEEQGSLSWHTDIQQHFKPGAMGTSHGPDSQNPKLLGPCFQVVECSRLNPHTEDRSHPSEKSELTHVLTFLPLLPFTYLS